MERAEEAGGGEERDFFVFGFVFLGVIGGGGSILVSRGGLGVWCECDVGLRLVALGYA